MVPFSKLRCLFACIWLSSPVLAAAAQESTLEDAQLGRVIATDDLLSMLMPKGPGATSRLVEEIEAHLAVESKPGVAQLLEHVRALPELVIAERRGIPGDSLDSTTWSQGTGIGLEVLEAIGEKASFTLLPKLMAITGEPSIRERTRHQKGLEVTIQAILMRQPDSYRAVGPLYAKLPEWCVPALLRAIASTRELAALHSLPGLLGKRDNLDAYLLTQIASVARYARAPLSRSDLSRIRRYLRSIDPEERQRAAQAIGFLDDADSADQLIELLQDPIPAVSQASYSALRLITAMTMDPGYRRWTEWYERETDWWQESSEPHLAFLSQPDAKGLVVALRELGSRRLFRRDIAPWIRPLLDSTRDNTVRVAISALTSLRANDEQTIAGLETLLSHQNAQIRQQASDSLRVITRRVFLPRRAKTPRPK